ncbi:MAG: MarR family winged helix-turn-helix transcriptional regulator [Pseudobdellovibrionaceae bacterium]
MKTTNTDSLSIFLDVLHGLQKIDPEFPIQYAICLVEISKAEGCSLTYLSDRTGLALSTISRIVGALSSYRQKGNPYGFISIKVAEEERRRKEIYLTPEGRTTLTALLAPLDNIIGKLTHNSLERSHHSA